MRKIFVTGIGTDVGKTIVSAMLVEALRADYWKPIQAGTEGGTDSERVESLISNNQTVIYNEAYRLREPMSPHAAADIEGIVIDEDKIKLPTTSRTLVIEGAGGIMVPINNHYFMIDLAEKFDTEIILVIQNYLGSINHSLLTIDALKNKGLKIIGLVFNGPSHPHSENIISQYSGLRTIAKLSQEDAINKQVIKKYTTYFFDI